jgi:AraC-like DNA-binding protein
MVNYLFQRINNFYQARLLNTNTRAKISLEKSHKSEVRIVPDPINSLDLTCEERLSDSPYISTVWRSRGESAKPFISMAQSQWGLVVTKIDGRMSITFRGPETRATYAFVPVDAEFVGILFKPGTLMPGFPARNIMDRADITLPAASARSFRLNSSEWQFPEYENIETFIDWLVRDDLLLYDSTVADVLQGKPVTTSLRTVQRRFLQATGLTHGTIAQINRARYATKLLKQGVSTLDTVHQADYADQPHLIRSMKRFIGFTPCQITAQDRHLVLSFLFNT